MIVLNMIPVGDRWFFLLARGLNAFRTVQVVAYLSASGLYSYKSIVVLFTSTVAPVDSVSVICSINKN